MYTTRKGTKIHQYHDFKVYFENLNKTKDNKAKAKDVASVNFSENKLTLSTAYDELKAEVDKRGYAMVKVSGASEPNISQAYIVTAIDNDKKTLTLCSEKTPEFKDRTGTVTFNDNKPKLQLVELEECITAKKVNFPGVESGVIDVTCTCDVTTQNISSGNFKYGEFSMEVLDSPNTNLNEIVRKAFYDQENLVVTVEAPTFVSYVVVQFTTTQGINIEVKDDISTVELKGTTLLADIKHFKTRV